MQRILALVLFILFASSSFAAEIDLQAALDKARLQNKVGAMQMTIIEAGKSPHTVVSGKTNKPKGSPAITPDTLFQIGSDTKSFTAAVMLKLEIDKKLKLSDKLSQYFPEYKAWGNVTISQMLHNNSGIPSYTADKKFQKKIFEHPDYVWTPAELIAIATKHPMNFKPGQGWHYSNSNFVLAGMIIEKVTNEKLGDLYQKYFISTLDLKNTFYSTEKYPLDVLNRMAHAYSEKNRDITFDNLSWGNAAGAIVSNSSDLATWGYDLFHGKVLPESALKQMMDLVSVKTGKAEPSIKEGYGLAIGMRIDKKYGKWWGHEGETLGYHAIFLWYPEYDLTVAIIANGAAPQLRDFAASVPGLLGIQRK